MKQENPQRYSNQEDRIDFTNLISTLLLRKKIIFALTSLTTLLTIIYALNLTPSYKVNSLFTLAPEVSIISTNKIKFSNESKESLLSSFIINLSSKAMQKKVFLDGNYLNLFNPGNTPIKNLDIYIAKILRTVEINRPEINLNDMKLGFLDEKPYIISMEGKSPEVISSYLNDLVKLANQKTISSLEHKIKSKISIGLDEISLERDLLLKQAEKDRFSKIERIKEEDGQKIRQINDQIFRARYQAKEVRLNQIEILIVAAKLAKSLGIIENNFNLINGDEASSDLTIAIGENKDLPEWYLYGEKALLQRVKILENRMSDDPFIAELVTLNNQLNEVQNNNLLKTLEERMDDSPFIDRINELDIQSANLESIKVDFSGIKSMRIVQKSLPPENSIPQNKKRLVLLAFFSGLLASIFLALAMEVLPTNKEITA